MLLRDPLCADSLICNWLSGELRKRYAQADFGDVRPSWLSVYAAGIGIESDG